MRNLQLSNSVLYKVADPVTEQEFGSKYLSNLIDNLKRLTSQFNGLGIAGPQCGVSKRVFYISQDHFDFGGGIINPTALDISKKTTIFKEGCLSFPGKEIYVERPECIVSYWYDPNGVKHMKILQGLQARVFLHELDHLNGVTIMERNYYGASK